MPCKDVTEMITVCVDAEDRLKEYRFIKRTCGQGVGLDILLIEQLRGKTLDEILAIPVETFLDTYPAEEELEEFLALKHLIAVQSAIEVLTGKTSGGAKEMCAAAEIQFEDGETVIEARINVDLVTEKIKSCGNCGGCGKNKKPKKVVVFN
jgi:hypothetical protein